NTAGWRFRMSSRYSLTAFALVGVLVFSPTSQGQPESKKITATHAFDLSCRKLGEPDITERTQKLGLEAYKDDNNGLGIYVSQGGLLAVGLGFQDLKLPLEKKNPEWVTGLDLPARGAGELNFDSAKVYSMEIFRDPHTNNCIFITEKGRLAVAAAGGKTG